METIHCIGDSHVSFFSGTDWLMPQWPEPSGTRDRLPFFRTYRVGPVLAWSLGRDGAAMQGREKVEEVLRMAVPPGAPVLFLFGEIDCRCHLLRQAEKQGRPSAALAEECADVYFDAVLELAGGRPVLFCSLPASTQKRLEGAEEEFPTVGTCLDRNALIRAFHAHLAERCQAKGVAFVDFFDSLVDESGVPFCCFFRDKIHLPQRAMPAALAALRRALPGFDGALPWLYRVKIALSRLTGMKVR